MLDICDEHGVWQGHSGLAILLDGWNQDARRDARRYRGRAEQWGQSRDAPSQLVVCGGGDV